jgi:replication factor C large subunit
MVGWTRKYRPKTLDDLHGNLNQIRKLEEWANNWEPSKGAVVLHGPPGVGKTTAAHAVAEQAGFEVVEMNASDKRTRSDIESVAGVAGEYHSLGEDNNGSTSLIIVDEADNLHGNYDRGGAGAITELVKSSNQPVILLANDFYELTRTLRNNVTEIEFDYLSQSELGKVLRDICDEENIEYDFDSLKRFAASANGDARSAVNDLQALIDRGGALTEGEIVTGERSQEVGIFPYLDGLLKEYTPEEAMENSRDVDETPDSMLRWIKDNIPKVYSGDELADAYEFISNADQWLGRTYATQEYKYWRYASDNLTAGVAASRNGTKSGWTRFGPPKYNSKNKTAQEVCRKIGQRAGTSVKIAHIKILPFLSAITHHCKPREVTVQMAAYYDFDEKEVSFITGSGKTTNKVEGIVEDAREIQSEVEYTSPEDDFDPEQIKEDEDTLNGKEEDTQTDEENEENINENTDTEEEDTQTDEEEDDQLGIGDFV